jgi:hypothetical protein
LAIGAGEKHLSAIPSTGSGLMSIKCAAVDRGIPMTSPSIDPSIESFLSPTRIYLFGKTFSNLTYTPTSTGGGTTPDPSQSPGPVSRALDDVGSAGKFARIYGFSYEGHYYKLPRPVLFLVSGTGSTAGPDTTATGTSREFSTGGTGVEGKDWRFGTDIRVWVVDRNDVAVRLDVEVGRYDEVLLQPLAAGWDESGLRGHLMARDAADFRGHLNARSAADFRGGGLGPHQAR